MSKPVLSLQSTHGGKTACASHISNKMINTTIATDGSSSLAGRSLKSLLKRSREHINLAFSLDLGIGKRDPFGPKLVQEHECTP